MTLSELLEEIAEQDEAAREEIARRSRAISQLLAQEATDIEEIRKLIPMPRGRGSL